MIHNDFMNSTVRPTIVFLGLLTLLLGVAYPALITGILQIAFKDKANGSLIQEHNMIRGSKLLGQPFTDVKYFWSRPSATTPFPYNTASSNGSNLSPANPALLDIIKQRVQALQHGSIVNNIPIPIDMVTASASGLDPHISLAAASYQVPRISAIRDIAPDELYVMIYKIAQNRTFSLLGEPAVNVVQLNLLLDKQSNILHGH